MSALPLIATTKADSRNRSRPHFAECRSCRPSTGTEGSDLEAPFDVRCSVTLGVPTFCRHGEGLPVGASTMTVPVMYRENNFFDAENVHGRVHPLKSDRNSDEATISCDGNVPFDPKRTLSSWRVATHGSNRTFLPTFAAALSLMSKFCRVSPSFSQ